MTGAPVLVDEFEPDPARGAYPGDPAPEHAPISHLELVARADVLCVAPASANTIAKLALGLADNLLTSAALAGRRPARARPGDEQPHVRAPGDPAQPRSCSRERGARIVAPGTGSLASRGEWGVGRLAEPAEILEALEAALAVGGPARRRCACSSRRAVRASRSTRSAIVGNRSSGRMGLALAHEAARRGRRGHARVRERVAAGPGRRPHDRRSRRPPSSRPRCSAEFAAADVLADGGRAGRLPPGEPRRRQDREDGPRRARDRARADDRHPVGRWPPAGARARRSSASPPSTERARSSAAAPSSAARASTPSS